jgi:hypothetical protein
MRVRRLLWELVDAGLLIRDVFRSCRSECALAAAHLRWREVRDRFVTGTLRTWCRDVRAHWRHGYVIPASAGVRCDVCGARFRSLADAGHVARGLAGFIHPSEAERIATQTAMEDKRHGGNRQGEHYEYVRRTR